MTPYCTILGSGTSNGIPNLGVNYPPEFLAEPKNHRTRSSVVLHGPTGNLLVDCSPEVRLQLTREQIFDIESVLITHTHADHIMGLDDIRSFCLKYQRPMTIYAWPQYQEDIKRIFPYAFADFPPGIFVPRFDLQNVPDLINVGGLEVQTFRVEHGKLPCVGIRANNFAYLTDVSHIPQTAWDKLQNLDVLVLDAVRIKPHPNHFHFEKSVEIAQELGAKVTYFTHLSDDFDHYKTESSLPPQIKLAYDGLKIPL